MEVVYGAAAFLIVCLGLGLIVYAAAQMITNPKYNANQYQPHPAVERRKRNHMKAKRLCSAHVGTELRKGQVGILDTDKCVVCERERSSKK